MSGDPRRRRRRDSNPFTRVVRAVEAAKKPPRRRRAPKSRRRVLLNAFNTRYDIVEECAEDRDWKVSQVEESSNWNVLWVRHTHSHSPEWCPSLATGFLYPSFCFFGFDKPHLKRCFLVRVSAMSPVF